MPHGAGGNAAFSARAKKYRTVSLMRDEPTDKAMPALVMQKREINLKRKTAPESYDALTAAAQILSAFAMWFRTQFATYA